MSKPEDYSNERYSLSELQKLIKQSLEDKLKSFYWVSAEISELKINYSGHCYLELVEKNRQEDIKSRARAIMWSGKARLLLPYFENIAGQPLAEDIKVLVRVKIDYHELYGLSLVINDIDPAYTVGEIAVKRKQIIKRLESEGVIDLNRELSMPLLPASIAVISSKQAAGYEDFTDELMENEHGYGYKTTLFSASMQGKETEASVIKSINKIYERISDFDIVVIVRGGGSQSDLSWFDNYNIAYLITQMPIPVLTGIGHEKDLSVTDIVAHRSFKTPTAVADYIINHSLKTEEYLRGIRESIINSSRELVKTRRLSINRISVNMSPLVREALRQKHRLLNRTGLRLTGSTRSYISGNRSKLETIKTGIRKRSSEFIHNRSSRINDLNRSISPACSRFTKQKHTVLDNLSRSIDYLSPARVLERGYSITLFNDKAVKSADKLKAGSRIKTILNKGIIDSEIFDLKKSGK